MLAPSIIEFTDISITVSWSALTSPNNGNALITGYNLSWDNGTNGASFVSLMDQLTTSYSVPSNLITPGVAYQFVVLARNIYGSAATYSSATSVTTIDAPGKSSTPTVTLGADAISVQITWTNTALTHGSPVDQYSVEFRTSTSNFVTDISCNPIPLSS